MSDHVPMNGTKTRACSARTVASGGAAKRAIWPGQKIEGTLPESSMSMSRSCAQGAAAARCECHCGKRPIWLTGLCRGGLAAICLDSVDSSRPPPCKDIPGEPDRLSRGCGAGAVQVAGGRYCPQAVELDASGVLLVKPVPAHRLPDLSYQLGFPLLLQRPRPQADTLAKALGGPR